jgi:putative selenium-binding protein YdfZ
MIKGETTMMTYDRNRNAITTGTRVMINGTGRTGKIVAIHANGLNAGQVRRSKTVEVEGCEGQFEPVELIRLGLH